MESSGAASSAAAGSCHYSFLQPNQLAVLTGDRFSNSRYLVHPLADGLLAPFTCRCLSVTTFSRVNPVYTKQSSSATHTSCNLQGSSLRPHADSHARAPLTLATADVKQLLPDAEEWTKPPFHYVNGSNSRNAASQHMPQAWFMKCNRPTFHAFTLKSALKGIIETFGQSETFVQALHNSFFPDWCYLWHCLHCATLCFGMSVIMSASISETNCSAAFATSLTSLDYTANLEEVQLPPIPKVFSPLEDLVPPVFEKVVLPNGLRVFLLEDHELGLVGGQLLIKGGSKNDPVDKVGLATISSIVQRSGGTKQHPAALLDVKLEEIAARIESASGISEMNVGFRCLSEDLREVMSLFSEVVQTPLMPKDKLNLARTQLLGSIKRRGDDPGGIAAREFSKLLYGEKSVYSRYFTEDTLMHITQGDLIAFHKRTFSPTSAVLGIWGDFDKETVKAMIKNLLSSWNGNHTSEKEPIWGKEEVPLPKLEIGNSFSEPYIYIVDKPGLNQGFVRMGELGTSISDPDVFALDVLSDMLNGFGGLLFDQVRSKEGLAYSVYGGWTPAAEHRGSFLAGGETQVNTVPQFIGSVQRVLQSATMQPPSEEDLRKAKEGIINSFVFNFVDSGVQLSRLMTFELFGIDQNFLLDYKKKVEEIRSDDILQTAKHHLHLGVQPILVVADASKVGPALQTLGRKIVVLHPEYLP